MEETELPINEEKYLHKYKVKFKNTFQKKRKFSVSESRYGTGK